MWEAPGRDRGTPEPGDGDALGGAPDSNRPANPWPRLLAFAAVVVTMIVLAGACLVSYARPPQRELRSHITEFSPGVPKFMPVTTLGADRSGRTFGAWVTMTGGGRVVALLSRDAATLCHVRWDAGAPNGGPQTGALVDPCGKARYASDGAVLDQSAARDLHAFPARIEGQTVIVNLMTITLGACRASGATGCSAAGQAEVRTLPSAELPPDFGRR